MIATAEKDLLLDHEYDGIKELDNDLPPWWLYLFYISVVFAVIYFAHYHILGTGDSSATEYQKEIDPTYVVEKQPFNPGFVYHSPYYNPDPEVTPQLMDKFSDYIGNRVSFDQLIAAAKRKATPENLAALQEVFPGGDEVVPAAAPAGETEPAIKLELLADEASLAAGKSIYDTNCAVCHGKLGEGGIGPNMTDKYWVHGGSVNDVVHIINVGVPAKGMIPWNKTLTAEKVHQVASYIISLEGTDPPNQKAAEGEPYER